MGQHRSISLWLSNMQDQKSLTLHWHSLLGGGGNIVTSMFAHRGGQYIDYGLKPKRSTLSIHDARSGIIDTLLPAHYSEGVTILSVALLPMKAAYIMIIGWRSWIACWLCRMQHPQSLLLHWRSFFPSGSDIFNTIFTHIGSQHFDYSLMSLHSSLNIQDARTEIVNTLLTHICWT